MKAAITASDVQFAALNLMSNNPGMRWDLDETRRVIGYNPQDGSPAQVPFLIALKSAIKAAFTSKLPRFFEKHFPHWGYLQAFIFNWD
ncbi:MAG: hypothetical protein ACPH74_01355 [Candidatus Puniceispirillum sp.]